MGIFSAFKEAMVEIVQDGASNYTRKSNNPSAPQLQSTPSEPRNNTSTQAPKPFAARIVGESLQIVDVKNGGIMRTHSLPPGKYGAVMVSGDMVTVAIEYMHERVKHRTINARTGSMVSEN
jgi:hypothetical protein